MKKMRKLKAFLATILLSKWFGFGKMGLGQCHSRWLN